MNIAAASGRPRSQSTSALARVLFLVYGGGTYLLFLATFLHVIGFVSGIGVPITIGGGRAASLTEALLVDGGFLALFAVQHMVMARRTFKRWWTRIVPPAAERTTFVLATCTILNAMIWQWRAIPGVAWSVEGPAAIALWSLSALGWLTVLYSTFLIDHFHLFGLRQSLEAFLGRPLSSPVFYERSLYRRVRHPLMLGFLIAFWSVPHMTFAMLFFAVMCTGYILVGVQVEEQTLIAEHGEAYRSYRRRVPMLLPWRRAA